MKFLNVFIRNALIIAAGAVMLFAVAPMAGEDPGIRDTVTITGGPLVVGQSRPLSLTIVNDFAVGAYSLGFVTTTVNGGFAKFDSVVYINRMADPNVLSYRDAVRRSADGVPPDTVMIIGEAFTDLLPPGNDAVGLVYFTGLTTGEMLVDSAYMPPGAPFILVNPGAFPYTPEFTALTVTVIEAGSQVDMSAPQEPFRVAAGTEVSFDVSGQSSEEYPVTISLLSFTGYDDETMVPVQDPIMGSGNPASFSWTPTPSDVGIWQAVFEGCDTSDACASVSVTIQVVADDRYLLAFDISQTPAAPYASGITHGSFDADPGPELFVTGIGFGNEVAAQLYDLTGSGTWSMGYGLEDGMPIFGPQTGYFNDDEYLDVITMAYVNGPYIVRIFLGDGNNGFVITGNDNDGNVTRSVALGEFTRDAFVDLASTWYDGVRIYAGGAAGMFQQISIVSTLDSALTVNSADFNRDGYDDLAVGTTEGIEIHLGDNLGGFTRAHFYAQQYGSRQIEITNQGSDFNEDGFFDLCISTPSVGGATSQLVLYLGNGDGSFAQQIVRTVRGQIFGNCVGDMDGDGHQDIAYVNGARQYVGILYGDGTGQFVNDVRYAVPHANAQFLDCSDVDLDGDLDLSVAANGADGFNNSLYLLTNQLNPGGSVAKSCAFSAIDDAEMELVSPTGRVFNRLRSTMSAGDFYRCNLNQNDIIDDHATLGAVETGVYDMSVAPKPGLPEGTPFSAEYQLAGQRFRLAKDIVMSPAGYHFPVELTDESSVLPRSGSITYADPPMFAWPGHGTFDFQLAGDIDFTDIIIDEVVDGAIFVPGAALAVSPGDTAIFYWRVRPHGRSAFDNLYAVNLIGYSPTSCGDADNSGAVNVGDIVYLINYIFKNGADPTGPADANDDGFTNVGDVVYLVRFIFLYGPPPAC
jgi:hypothetical protein